MDKWSRDQSERSQRCRRCGSHVSADFARTFGDDDSVAHRCLQCDSFGRIASGSAYGADVGDESPIPIIQHRGSR